MCNSVIMSNHWFSCNVQVIEWTLHWEDDKIKPSIKRIFGTLAEAKEFYTNDARLAGFSVRKRTLLLDKNRELVTKYFFCSKEGLKEDRKIKKTDGLTDEGYLVKVNGLHGEWWMDFGWMDYTVNIRSIFFFLSKKPIE